MSGINPGNFRPTKKLPAPFQRPSISIGGGESKKREWRFISVLKIEEGDILPDLGMVHSVSYENIDDPANMRVCVEAGESKTPIKFEAGITIKAFA